MNNEPNPHPVIGPALLQFWEDKYIEGGHDHREMSIKGASFRHSWAGWCARKIEYALREYRGEEFETEAIAMADRWRMEMGTIVHDYWQAAIQHVFPDAEIEHITKLNLQEGADDLFSAGHGDCLIHSEQFGKIAIELKSRNGFGYKMDIGNKGSDPEGPASSAIRQGALNAMAVDADHLVVLHLSLESVSPGMLPQPHKGNKFSPMRMTAEWWYPKEEYMKFAEHELARASAIVGIVNAGANHAPRSTPDMPAGARIVDPMKSKWELWDHKTGLMTQTGQLWNGKFCDYCQYRDKCLEEGL